MGETNDIMERKAKHTEQRSQQRHQIWQLGNDFKLNEPPLHVSFEQPLSPDPETASSERGFVNYTRVYVTSRQSALLDETSTESVGLQVVSEVNGKELKRAILVSWCRRTVVPKKIP